LLYRGGRATVSLVVSPSSEWRGEVTSTSSKAITARQAAVEVLREASGPLKSAEIARRVLAVKGVKLAGKTPGATVAALAG